MFAITTVEFPFCILKTIIFVIVVVSILYFLADNGSMYLWDWKTGYNFQRMQATVQPGSLDSEAGIFSMTFDMSGYRLITTEADKTIKIYKEDEIAVSCTCCVYSCTTLTQTLLMTGSFALYSRFHICSALDVTAFKLVPSKYQQS